MTKSGIIIVDKPGGLTSHGVVSRLRRILNERRIGHGGTLDPMATGVLPIFVGKATRASSMMLNSDKSYRASFQLGIVTDTQDITGTVLARSDNLPSDGEVKEVLFTFLGRQMQVPPQYSAIKVGGKKLYEIARAGGSVDIPPREITIHTISGFSSSGHTYSFDVHCSKGTYIRTLVHDIGTALGCGATLTGLRRTSTGIFNISSSRTLEDITASAEEGSLSEILTPVDVLFTGYPKIDVDEHAESLCRNGALIPFDSNLEKLYGHLPTGTRTRTYGPQGTFLMVADIISLRGKNHLKTVKNFFETG